MKQAILLITTSIILISCNNNRRDENKNVHKNLIAVIAETKNLKEIKIGNQRWLAENLNVSHFRNGDTILQSRTAEEWAIAAKDGNPTWCYYEYDSSNGEKYGKLYNWFAVIDSSGLAPAGWHVPSDSEWVILINQVGGQDSGNKLKSISGWVNNNKGKGNGNEYDGNGNGNNISGFTGLPAGDLSANGKCTHLGYNCYWWSSTEYSDDTHNAFVLVLDYDLDFIDRVSSYISRTNYNKGYGCSVRCIKN